MSIYDNDQQQIAEHLSNTDQVSLSNWTDWRWQLRHSITRVKTFETLLAIELEEKERRKLDLTLKKFPLSITPYYLSLIDRENFRNDPVFRQAFPDSQELEIGKHDMSDPLAEDSDSPVAGITHRYPDRVLLHISNVCSMYCRHCTRKRKVGDVDSIPDPQQVREGIDYIRNTPEVRDVLLSGGDPLMLNDAYLDWVLEELGKIEHVQVIRIGTRMPVVLPYRITDDLIKILKKHQPVWVNTHFNHPKEITSSSKAALAKLADGGVPLGNQTVLLAGVNDCVRIIKSLSHKLVENRVRPYYLYQCDLSEGLSHFRTPIGKGVEIMEGLIGHTSGFAVPTYVVDAPGGGGKIPVTPNYLISLSTNKVVLRNFEGTITTYQEPDKYEAQFCNRRCDRCDLELQLEDGQEVDATGIEKLLCDYDETISLTPSESDRMERRDDN